MRVSQLLEQEDVFDFEKFKKDCAPFLKEMKGSRTMPYHGTHAGPEDYEIRTFRERIGPRDMPRHLHDEINAHMKDSIGHEIRNWMFVTGSVSNARSYGALYAVFPIGVDFHYVWSPYVEDMTTHRTIHVDQSHADPEARHLPYDDRIRHADDKFLNDIETTTFKVDEDLKRALESDHEIHLKCKNFYMIKVLGPTFENVVNPYLRKRILQNETD